MGGFCRTTRKLLHRLWLWSISRKGAPVYIGLVLGFLISDFRQDAPFTCEQKIYSDNPHLNTGKSDSSAFVLPLPKPLGGVDYEPAVLIDNRKIPPSVQKAPYPVRPRYYASELGIHDTLYVAVASATVHTLHTLAVALNNTAAQYLQKISFFVNSQSSDLPLQYQNNSMTIIRAADARETVHPLLIIKFLIEHHMDHYDWFFLTPDSVFVRGNEIEEFVKKKLSVGGVEYMGAPLEGSNEGFCDFSAGILLSQGLMRLISKSMHACLELLDLEVISVAIGTCVQKASGVRCSETSSNIVFPTFRLSDLQSLDTQDSAYQLVEAEEGLRSSLTIYSLSQPEQYYRLHLELSQRKIAEMEQTIEELQEDIVKQSPHTPAKGEDLKWPIGVNAPTVPKNRFDLVEWTYFNQTHLFRPDDFLVVTPIVGSHLRSMQMVLLYAKKEMEDRYMAEDFKLSKVVNGYVRFDPARGMEYLLDMEFQMGGTSAANAQAQQAGDFIVENIAASSKGINTVIKRVRLLRALGKMEQISLPFVTENSRVHITIPLTGADVSDALVFLQKFVRVHLETQDNVFLMFVFIYGPNDPGKDDQADVFRRLKADAKDVEKRFTKTLGARLGWVSIRNPLEVQPSELAIMDLVARKFSKDSIVLRSTVGLEPSTDLLNRVRLTTIPGSQAYFPIPFMEYQPDITQRGRSDLDDFEVKRQLGHFGRDSVVYAGFYISDYVAARKSIASEWPVVTLDRDIRDEYPRPTLTGKVYDLYSLFLMLDIHLFRAVEPALKVRYRPLNCEELKDPNLDGRLLERCERMVLASLANKQQLSLFIASRKQQD